jgi:hypothetical protein
VPEDDGAATCGGAAARLMHAVDYVRTRTPSGTLSRNVDAVEQALRRREAEGYRLVAAVPETDNGDLTGVLLLFVRE